MASTHRGDSKPRQRRVLPGLLVVLCAALLGGWCAWYLHAATNDPVPDGALGEAASTGSPAAAKSSRHDAPSAPRRPFLEPGRAADDSAGSFTVQLVDALRKPVPAVALVVELAQPNVVDGGDTRAKTLSTDDDGCIQVAGTRGDARIVRLVSMDFCFARPGTADDGMSRLTIQLGRDTQLVVRPNTWMDVSVSYQDGMAYEGRIELDLKPAGIVALDVVDGFVRFLPPLGAAGVEVRAMSRRAGFDDARHAGKVTINPDPIRLVLASSGRHGGIIVVDLVDLPRSQSARIGIAPTFRANGARSIAEYGIGGGQTYRSAVLAPGEYRVFVRESTLTDNAWHDAAAAVTGLVWNGSVIVVDGQDSMLAPELEPCCSLRVRVVNAAGEPISGALVRPAGTAYTRWQEFEKLAPGRCQYGPVPRALTDRDGVALIHGIAAQEQAFAAEGPGYEPQALRVILAAGSITDAGEIRLLEARGTIRVKAVFPPGVTRGTCELLLLQPAGSDVARPVQFDGDEHVVSSLPLRPYAVSLRESSGRFTCNSQSVVLDESRHEVELTFVFRQTGQ